MSKGRPMWNGAKRNLIRAAFREVCRDAARIKFLLNPMPDALAVSFEMTIHY